MNQAAATTTGQRTAPTPVAVVPTRTVTYKLVTGPWASVRSSERNLKIPYEVAFNGVVQRRQRGWPDRIKGGTEFRIQAPQGTRVGLYLNTDSLEGSRQHCAYEVTAGERDAYVTVTESRGTRPATTATATFSRTDANPTTGRQTDFYTAPLHENIWARISTVYTAADAEATLPAQGDASLRAAVVSIYRVLASATLDVLCTSPRNHRISVAFVDSDNPRQNVSDYDFLRDGLTRVHPLGYYALLEAARAAGATRLSITSCWRPSLGSIAHRAGVGLDVNIVADAGENFRINSGAFVRGADNLPELFRTFRDTLQASPHVKQLFDPWYMDKNTRDDTPPEPNTRSDDNQRLHSNHLHITLNVEGIL